MIRTNPCEKMADLDSEYVYDHTARNCYRIYCTNLFGGCIFDKMGQNTKNGGSVTNFLERKVRNYEIAYLYGGGYYKFENIPDPENGLILDVEILIPVVAKHDEIEYLKELMNNQEALNR